METNVGHGRKWVCLCKCTVKGGWRTPEQCNVPTLQTSSGWRWPLCLPWKPVRRDCSEEQLNHQEPAWWTDTRPREDKGVKLGISSGRKEVGMQGGRRGRTAFPIFRSGLSPLLRRGGVRVPWERTEQQEGRWIWWGCVRKPRWYPDLDTSWPSFTKKPWPPH